MTDQQILTSDDWTRNWNASIAVKITAVVIWGLMPLAFLVVIPTLTSSDDEIVREYQWDFNQLTRFAEVELDSKSAIDIYQLKQDIARDKHKFGFRHLTIKYQDRTLMLGKPEQQGISLHNAFQYGENTIELIAVYRPLVLYRNLQQAKYGTAIVLCMVLFGLFLNWVVRIIVTRPFATIINAIQLSAEGESDIRLDENRDDEFGTLSNFFNRMMIELHSRQVELEETNRELRREVLARDEALTANHAKSVFLANMSHEIRTPLTSVIGYAESLYRFRNHSVEERMHALKTIVKNGNHLLAIINDNLDVSKIEADKLDIEIGPASPFLVLNDVVALMQGKANAKHLRFIVQHHFPLPAMVLSNATRMRQILINLVSNAIHHTDKGQIVVSINYERLSNKLKFVVRDTGIGLSDAQISRLFQPYVQEANEKTARPPGTGLGLVISRRLANLLGGDIRVTGIEGVGSTFEFLLDAGNPDNLDMLSSEEEIEQRQEGNTDGALCFKGGKVLLVEDVEDNQRLISLYLRQAGLDVVVASNGLIAVEMAMKDSFNLVLMDMQMPVMDGVEATQALLKQGYEVPIVALTANALGDSKQEYLDIGCVDVLLKPLELNKFYEVLRKFIAVAETGEPREVAATMTEAASSLDGYSEIEERFFAAIPDYLYELDVAIDQHNWKAADGIAHKLKGLGGSFGQMEISDLAAEIMQGIAEESPSMVKEKFEALAAYCQPYLDLA